MTGFKSILAVLPEDSLHEVALARAIHLAKANGAALTVVDVVDTAPSDLSRLMQRLPGVGGTDIEEDVIAYHRERLGKLADSARAAGLDVSEAVLRGRPFVEVIRMVLREGHDIVIKGAATGQKAQAQLDGFDMHLLRKCGCPVWLLMGEGDGTFDTVLAAVDPEDSDDPLRDGLNRSVLDLATSFAERDKAAVHVVHAWHLQAEQALRHGRYSRQHPEAVERILDQTRQAAKDQLAALVADYPQIPADRVHLIKGRPGEAIADFVNDQGSDVLVMGTVGRTGLAGFIMGNTAETILRRVACSVIAVKPDGFVSPVTLDTAS